MPRLHLGKWNQWLKPVYHPSSSILRHRLPRKVFENNPLSDAQCPWEKKKQRASNCLVGRVSRRTPSPKTNNKKGAPLGNCTLPPPQKKEKKKKRRHTSPATGPSLRHILTLPMPPHATPWPSLAPALRSSSTGGCAVRSTWPSDPIRSPATGKPVERKGGEDEYSSGPTSVNVVKICQNEFLKMNKMNKAPPQGRRKRLP